MEIAIIKATTNDCRECYDLIAKSITNWEEVTQEDYELLSKNIHKLNKYNEYYLIIVRQYLTGNFDTVTKLKVETLKELEKEKEAKNKKLADEAARKKKAEETKRKRELKLLQELTNKYMGTNK